MNRNSYSTEEKSEAWRWLKEFALRDDAPHYAAVALLEWTALKEAEKRSRGPLDSELPGAIKLAVWLHDTYEELAPLYGYETRQETRLFNASSPNGKLMIAVCGRLREKLMRSPATPSPIEKEE